MGGALVKRTILVVVVGPTALGIVGVVGMVAFGAFARKYLKNLSVESGKPSHAGKFSVAQNSLYAVVKILNWARPSGEEVFGFVPVMRLKMAWVE